MKLITILIIFAVSPLFLKASQIDYQSIKDNAISLMNSSPDSALQMSLKGLRLAEQNKASDYIWKFQYNIAYLYDRKLQDDGKALNLYLEASANCPDTSSQKPRILNMIGRLLERHSSYELAIKYYSDALKFADLKTKSIILLNRGNTYAKKEAYQMAESDYQNAIAICDQLGETRRKFNLYNQLGLVYIETGLFDQAKEQFNEIINYQQLENYRKYAGWAFHNLGYTNQKQGYFDVAQEYFQKALEIKSSEKEKFITYMDVGTNFLMQDDHKAAISWYHKAEASYQQQYATPETFKIWKLLKNTSKKMKDYEAAFAYSDRYESILEKYSREKEAIAGKIDGIQIETIINQYHTNKQNRLNQLILTQSMNIAIAFAILGFLIASLILGNWYYKKRLVHQIINS